MKHNLMSYKGYAAKIEFDDRDSIFTGRILHINDVIAFEGSSVKELKEAFHDAVDDYLDWCNEEGTEPDKPYSGQFVLRVDSELHKEIANEAAAEGVSLNFWVMGACKSALIKHDLSAVYNAATKQVSHKYIWGPEVEVHSSRSFQIHSGLPAFARGQSLPITIVTVSKENLRLEENQLPVPFPEGSTHMRSANA